MYRFSFQAADVALQYCGVLYSMKYQKSNYLRIHLRNQYTKLIKLYSTSLLRNPFTSWTLEMLPIFVNRPILTIGAHFENPYNCSLYGRSQGRLRNVRRESILPSWFLQSLSFADMILPLAELALITNNHKRNDVTSRAGSKYASTKLRKPYSTTV